MSILADVADAVAEELAAADLSLALAVERRWRPRWDLPESDAEVHAFVVPRGQTEEPATRSQVALGPDVDVVLVKKLASAAGEEDEEMDGLMDLAGEVAGFFRLRRLAAYPAAVWTGTARDPAYSPQHLDELRTFSAAVTLSYRVAAP